MRTKTILSAWDVAETRLHNLYMWRESRNVDIEDRLITKLERLSRVFRAALLARIEAGDRAREALRQVEWVQGNWTSHGINYCPWCSNHKDNGHATDCPRQIALGLQEQP
jgi:hypothetical protein